MKKRYYFDYTFSFDISCLCAKLCSFLDTAIPCELEKHGFAAGNYTVKVCFGKKWRAASLCLARENAFWVSVFSDGEIVITLTLSIVSDTLRSVSVGNKTLYAVDFEKDCDKFVFEVSSITTSISDAEARMIAQFLVKAFVSGFSIPCRVSVKDFSHVTFNILFSQRFDPPDSKYICSLLGYGATALKSRDPYRVIIDVDFSGKHPLVLHDAVGKLDIIKHMINDISIT